MACNTREEALPEDPDISQKRQHGLDCTALATTFEPYSTLPYPYILLGSSLDRRYPTQSRLSTACQFARSAVG
jgi:hypothetical protein